MPKKTKKINLQTAVKFAEDHNNASAQPNKNTDKDISSDDDELNEFADIDVSKKSLKNTDKSYSLKHIKKKNKKVLPMGAIISGILDKDLSKRKYKKVIFTDKKQKVKEVKKERINAKIQALKRSLKKKQKNLGRTLPDYHKERDYERGLKMIAVEGITKLFNAMATIQKDSLDEVLRMQLDDKIGKGRKRPGAQKKRRGPGGGKKGGGFLGKVF